MMNINNNTYVALLIRNPLLSPFCAEEEELKRREQSFACVASAAASRASQSLEPSNAGASARPTTPELTICSFSLKPNASVAQNLP